MVHHKATASHDGSTGQYLVDGGQVLSCQAGQTDPYLRQVHGDFAQVPSPYGGSCRVLDGSQQGRYPLDLVAKGNLALLPGGLCCRCDHPSPLHPSPVPECIPSSDRSDESCASQPLDGGSRSPDTVQRPPAGGG